MKNTRWEQRHEAITHLLTSPTTTPQLYSQFFIASRIPCYFNWDYPPVLCSHHSQKSFISCHLKWGISLFLRRVSRLGLPLTSWRSKCPYHQPPPLILAKGVEEAKWGDQDRRVYVRNRFTRGRYGKSVNPWIPVLIPNLLAFSLFLWYPFPDLDA